MSLHAELSPEAIQRLHTQRRNSTISSIVVAVLMITLVVLILGILLLPALDTEKPEIALVTPGVIQTTPPDDPPPVDRPTSNPTPPAHAPTRVLVVPTTSLTSISMPDVDVSTPSMEFGMNVDIGDSDGFNPQDSFDHVPPVMSKRCSPEDRLARLRETGGTPECDDAVIKALDWFKATQSADGSWGAVNKPAMTGLALLAYLGHCETPRSPRFGETVLRGITYLIDLGMRNDGKLGSNLTANSWPYEHAIATYALAEASTFCKQSNIAVPGLYDITQKAGRFIIDHQHPCGGWAYAYNTADKGAHVDSSVSAWQIQALNACRHTGLDFKGLDRASRKAMGYIMALQSKDGGFGYTSAGENPHAAGYRTMTGGCVLSLQMFDKGSSPAARKGINYINENTRFDYNGPCSDLYGHYYEAQAMMNRGGATWDRYNRILRDQLLANQNPDGSWMAPNKGSKNGIRAVAPVFVDNVHYRTALCALMLEVYYRFLPGSDAGIR